MSKINEYIAKRIQQMQPSLKNIKRQISNYKLGLKSKNFVTH